jgi:hypothetical protein
MLKSTSLRRAQMRSERTNVVERMDVEQKLAVSASPEFFGIDLCDETRPLL